MQIVVERCVAETPEIPGCDSIANRHSLPVIAPGARHQECGSHEAPRAEIKIAGHGGPRKGAGRKPKPVSAPPAIASAKPGLRWFCLQTAPRGELLAVLHLLNKGFHTFLPLHQPAAGQVLRPLFPGWLFVQFDHAAGQWGRINGAPGVRQLYADTPLAQELIEHLIELYGPNGKAVYPPGVHQQAPIEVGSVVRVLDGSAVDMVGICQWSDGDKVRLLMQMMGGQVRVTVARHLVVEVKG